MVPTFRAGPRPREAARGRSGLLLLLAAGGLALSVGRVTAAPASPGAAAEIPPAEDVAGPYKGWEVRSLEIRGLDPSMSRNVRSGLALTPRGPLRKRPLLFPKVLADDMARIRLHLARNGFPHARITPAVTPRDGREQVAVVLSVEPGPMRRIGDVLVEGWPDTTPRPGVPRALLPGSRFADAAVRDFAEDLASQLAENGHAFAKATPRIERIDGDAAQVTIRVDPGSRFVLGDVRITGCRESLRPLVVRAIHLRPGTPYSPDRLVDVEERLRLLELFRQVRITVEESAPDTLVLVVDLVERDMRSLEAGLGYWTDEQLRPHGRWRHRDLLGGGRGGEIRLAYSRFSRLAGASVWWLAAPGPRTRLDLSGRVEQQVEKSYDLLDRNVSLAALTRVNARTSLRAALELSRVDVTVKADDPSAFAQEGGLLTTVVGTWIRDATNDRVEPTDGTTLWTTMETSLPGGLSDAHFVSLESSVAGYRPLAPEWTGAARLTVGIAAPTGDSPDLLPNKRFFAGGARSMRGFERRRLGPHDASGSPIGGEAKLEGTLELRFPIVRIVRGAVFLDAAQVFSRRQDLDPGQLEYAAGPALMARTPVGPVRIDWGFRLTDRDPDAPSHVLHVSIGHPF